MKLYSYWGSSTAYRVRAALNLKGLDHDIVAVDLVAGAQHDPDYVRLNPVHGVPTLVLDNGTVLTQSMAILEWLEETHPDPPLLPQEAVERARVRAAAMIIASEVHPVNNLRIRKALGDMGHSQDEVIAWMVEWMSKGLGGYQALLPRAEYSFGDTPGYADICLVPQLYNARRWGVDLAPFSRLVEIETRCLALPAFAAASPEAQPDAET